MKTQIATTPEQSQRLTACGVDKDTADFYWCDFIPDEPSLSMGEIPRNNDTGEVISDGDLPAWSFSALLALLPMEVNEEGLQTVFHLTYYPDELKWAAEYYDYAMDKYLCSERDYTPIEACVKAIEYLTANGYTLNTK